MAGLHFLNHSKIGKRLEQRANVGDNGDDDGIDKTRKPLHIRIGESDPQARLQKSLCLNLTIAFATIGFAASLIFIPKLICRILGSCNSNLIYGIVFGATLVVSLPIFIFLSCYCWKCCTNPSSSNNDNNTDEPPAAGTTGMEGKDVEIC